MPKDMYIEYERLKAKCFLLLMSEEVKSVETGTLAGELFDIVGDITHEQAAEALRAWKETQ